MKGPIGHEMDACSTQVNAGRNSLWQRLPVFLARCLSRWLLNVLRLFPSSGVFLFPLPLHLLSELSPFFHNDISPSPLATTRTVLPRTIPTPRQSSDNSGESSCRSFFNWFLCCRLVLWTFRNILIWTMHRSSPVIKPSKISRKIENHGDMKLLQLQRKTAFRFTAVYGRLPNWFHLNPVGSLHFMLARSVGWSMWFRPL